MIEQITPLLGKDINQERACSLVRCFALTFTVRRTTTQY